MTDPFDADLRRRLDGLAAAVPARGGDGTERVPAITVRPGAAGQGFSLVGSVPIVAVLTVAALLGGILAIGLVGSSGTDPVAATVREGDFELTIRSERGRYLAGEPVRISATLTYRGTLAEVPVAHGHGSPMAFGIREPVGGAELRPGWRSSREITPLARDVPLTKPFAKSGGFSGSDADADAKQSFFEDPDLILPVGTWHVYVLADFEDDTAWDGSHGTPYEIEAEIAIAVVDRASAETAVASPEPTATSMRGHIDVAREGPDSLELRAGKATYVEGEAIDVEATFRYAGDTPVTLLSRGPVLAVGFGIEERVYGMSVATPMETLLSCSLPLSRPVAAGETFSAPFEKAGEPKPNDPGVELQRAFLDDPVLRLPPGTWHLYAEMAFAEVDRGCDTDFIELRPLIQIEVLPRPVITNPPPSYPAVSPGPVMPDGSLLDVVRDDLFQLQIGTFKGTFGVGEPIEIAASYQYIGPDGSVTFGHSRPAAGFFIKQLDGPIEIGRSGADVCEHTTLGHGTIIDVPFFKIGGYSSTDPNRAWYEAYFEDPLLHLPEGTWQVGIGFESFVSDCGEERHDLEASIVIEVLTSPASPIPTADADGPLSVRNDDGMAFLQLSSPHATYLEGVPIEVEAIYGFEGGRPLVASHYDSQVSLMITQVDATDPGSVGTTYEDVCIDLGRVDGQDRRIPLSSSILAIFRADEVPTSLDDLFVDGALVLPVGRWRIALGVDGSLAPCGQPGVGFAVLAAIEIEVVPG